MKQPIAGAILVVASVLVVRSFSGATDCAPIKHHLKVRQVCGHVTDISGASIANAKVELLDDQLEVQKQTVADDRGNFMLSDVAKGQYKIVVEASGYAASNPQPLVVTKTDRENTCQKPLKATLNVGVGCNAFGK